MRTEIVPGLFVGDRYAAENLGVFIGGFVQVVPKDWHVISVTEYDGVRREKNEIPNEPAGASSKPFMDKHNAARIAMLDDIASEIQGFRMADKRVLVHCVQAKERSPLAIAWYLWRFQYARDLDAAYAIVIAKHPITQRRDAWVTAIMASKLPS